MNWSALQVAPWRYDGSRAGPGRGSNRAEPGHPALLRARRSDRPIERSVGGRRRYDEDDLAWIGIVTCLREAGLGISDLRRFTELLRTEGPGQDRVTFLRQRREEMLERLRQTQAALAVLDGKIAHYSGLER